MILKIRYFVLLCALVLLAENLYAQNGSISGEVIDKKSRETIIGANVILKGTTTGASTDLDGKFLISGLSPGKYSLEVSFISYKKLTITDVIVAKGQTTLLYVELEEEVAQIQGVVVTATRKTDSELSVVSTIRASNLVVSGISSQQITKSQDNDASEVIRRIPGVTIVDGRFVMVRGLNQRYNNVLLNNASTPSSESDVKAFSFDMIPSSQIDNILIYKTPAPDLPADFAGGAIRIFTKNNVENNSFSFSVQGGWREGTTFNDFFMTEGGRKDWLGFDDGTRAMPEITPEHIRLIKRDSEGLALKQSIGQAFNKNWIAKRSVANPDQKYSLGITRKFKIGKMCISNITSANYSNSNSLFDMERAQYQNYDTIRDQLDTSYYYHDLQYTNNIQWAVLHNWALIMGKHKIEIRNLFNQQAFNRTTLREGKDFYGGQTQKGYAYRFMSRSIYTGQISGTHKWRNGNSEITWTGGYSYANRNEPDMKQLTTTLNEDPDDPHYGDYYIALSHSVDPKLAGRVFSEMEENIYGGDLNYKHKFEFAGWQPEIKVGVFTELKDRFFSARNIGYVKAKTSKFDPDIIYMPFDSVFADTNINNTFGLTIDETTSASDKYEAGNEMKAGYVSLTIPIGTRFHIYSGVRAEHNVQTLNSNSNKNPKDTIDVRLDTLNFFPSANITYNLNEKSLIRLGYGLTINRPEFREIAPFVFYDFERKAAFSGNDTLKNCFI
ncbi:MAG: TonB-dependent receptor, partial [Bacteroidetes bacterium]|nr:TonB-dependent receptor [Bacteroidota bacterium]